MAKVPRSFYAIVKMVIVRQIDFSVPPDASDEELEKMVLDQAERDYGSSDDVEITEMDYR